LGVFSQQLKNFVPGLFLTSFAILLLFTMFGRTQSNMVSLISSPGDFVGQGKTYITADTNAFSIIGDTSMIIVSAFGFDFYISSPDGTNMTVGTYSNTSRLGGGSAGFQILGNGRGCDNDCGSFQINELHTNVAGNVDRLWIIYSNSCECFMAPMTGEIRYNSQLAPPAPPPPVPRILMVPKDYPTIQSAINDASVFTNDTVLVAPGTYYENLNLNDKAITVISESGPLATIIDGSNAGSVVNFTSGAGTNSVINGFTIQHGASQSGGGVALGFSSATIVSNIFKNNVQIYGGFGAGIGGNGASPIIEHNVFQNNSAQGDNQYTAGVVCFVNDSSPWIADNIFLNNASRAINMIFSLGNRTVVINNTIVGNTVGIRGNNNEFSGNSSGQFYYNNILFDNSIGLEVDFLSAGNYPNWANNLVFGGQTTYSGISDQTGLNGNISADPIFACPTNGDFHLLKISPCIDAGTNLLSLLPATDFDGNPRIIAGVSNGAPIVDMGAYEFNPAAQYSACSILRGPNAMTVECGSPATVTDLVDESAGTPFVLFWSLNGIVVQTNLVAASQSEIITNISWVAELPLGTNLVEAMLADSVSNTAYSSTIVTVVDTTPPTLVCPTNITVDFTDLTGARVFFTVTATDICSGTLPVNCTPPSGSIFPIGTNTVTCTATDISRNISQSNFLVTVRGALGVKTEVLAELLAFRSAHRQLLQLNSVIECLKRAIIPNLWADEMHIKSSGDDVFNEEADAVLYMCELKIRHNDEATKIFLQRCINQLIQVDRILAAAEIKEATNAGATSKQLANASKELIRGDAEAMQLPMSAILHYQRAWSMAMQLINN
jgi:hypothetical protein